MSSRYFPLLFRFNQLTRLGSIAAVAWALTGVGYENLTHARQVSRDFTERAAKTVRVEPAPVPSWPDFGQKTVFRAPQTV